MEQEVRYLRRKVIENSTQIAVLMDWRKSHDHRHTNEERRHADMPGRAIAISSFVLMLIIFAITAYSGGYGP